jgi:SAM-dependent methyltransferase
MPIIALGSPSTQGEGSVEVASTGVRRSSLPPPPASNRPPLSGIEEETTPLRTRAPADSLIQAIPSPRPPTKSDPNLARPSFGRGEPVPDAKASADDAAKSSAGENGSAVHAGGLQAGAAPMAETIEEEEAIEEDEDLEFEEEPDPERTLPEVAAVGPPSASEILPDDLVDSERATELAPSEARPESAPGDRLSEPPPEVEPEDVEIHESAAPLQSAPQASLKQPPPIRLPLPLPLYARGAELAAAVQAQQTTESPATKRARYWWDELFGDDFLRTMDRLTEAQVKNEVHFIEESLGVQKGGIILDLACGSGRHAVELSLRGYNVVGYDLSLAMLARAADEAHEKDQKLNFLHGDMRDMGFDEMFDGVYCWSTSFGYFDDEKNQLVAQKIHRALRSGGMLLLDVANRDFVTQRQPSLVWFEGDGCVCMDEMRVDFITSRLKVKRMVILEDGRTRELDYSIRLYTLHELGRMLHDVGFKVTEVSGHPATPGVFMGADSPRLIVLCEKD